MLGISALHLSALTPTDSILAYSSRHYLDHAVGKHQIALINVEEHNVESLLATVILICDHTWLASHSTALNEPYTLPLQTYHLARGIQVLFEQMCPTLRHLWYTKLERMPADDFDISLLPQSDPFLLSAERDLAILSQSFDNPGVSWDTREVYEQAVT